MKLRLPASVGVRVAAGLLGLGLLALGGAGATYSAMDRQADRIAGIARAAEGPLLVERLRAEVYAVVMESRGLYVARDPQQARRFAGNLRGFLARVEADWRRLQDVLPPEQRAKAAALDPSLHRFVELRSQLAQVGVEQGRQAADKLGNNDANRSVREAFSRSLDVLAKTTADQVAHLQAQAVAAGRRAALTLLAATALVVVAAVALALWFMDRSVALPLRRLTSALGSLAEGTLDGVALPPAGPGEIGGIAGATAVLVAKLRRNRELEARASAERNNRTGRQATMDGLTQRFGLSVSGVMASLGDSGKAMRETAEVVEQAIQATRGDAATNAAGAEDSARGLATVAAATEQLTASVGEVAQQVAGSARAAREAVARSEATAATVRDLSEAAGQIGDVVRLIAGIAGRTNLLALNATIEAARAGEAGRGFAVVALEVKQLAQQTAEANERIGQKVSAIQAATVEAVASMQAVGEAIRSMDAVAAAIAAGVEQQNAATRGIAASVQAVAQQNAAAAQAMRRVAEVADNAGAASGTVLAAVADMERVTGALRAEVDEFLSALRQDEIDRRLQARYPGNGAPVTVRLGVGAMATVELVDLSRSGAALACDLTPPPGTAVEVTLPGGEGGVSGEVSRVADGIVGLAFRQDGATRARVELAVAALQGAMGSGGSVPLAA